MSYNQHYQQQQQQGRGYQPGLTESPSVGSPTDELTPVDAASPATWNNNPAHGMFDVFDEDDGTSDLGEVVLGSHPASRSTSVKSSHAAAVAAAATTTTTPTSSSSPKAGSPASGGSRNTPSRRDHPTAAGAAQSSPSIDGGYAYRHGILKNYGSTRTGDGSGASTPPLTRSAAGSSASLSAATGLGISHAVGGGNGGRNLQQPPALSRSNNPSRTTLSSMAHMDFLREDPVVSRTPSVSGRRASINPSIRSGPNAMFRSFVSHSSFVLQPDDDGLQQLADSGSSKGSGHMPSSRGVASVDRLKAAKNGRAFFFLLAFLVLAALSGTLTVYFIRYSNSTASTRQKPLDLTIKLDSRLHKSLYGLDYTPPFGGQYDQGCYITQQDVLNHVKLMSQLTTRIRLYGMDCLVADFTLNAVRLLNVNLSVVLTLWEDNDIAMITRQRKELYRVVEKYKGENISYISVGNEVLLRAADKGDQAEVFMGKEIDKTRVWLKNNGYAHISVVTTDVADSWSAYPDIINHSDEAWGNVHPFFAGVLPETGWDFAIKSLNSEGTGLNWISNKTGKTGMISEIGWPTAPLNESYQASVPTIANMNTFLNLWVCRANQAGIRYFWFEAFDCPWKEAFSIREASWGLFDRDLNLKDGVVIPQCDV